MWDHKDALYEYAARITTTNLTPTSRTNFSNFDLDVAGARELLASNPDWPDYYAHVGLLRKNPVLNVGRFTPITLPMGDQ